MGKNFKNYQLEFLCTLEIPADSKPNEGSVFVLRRYELDEYEAKEQACHVG
jgi:hypothetical protein